MMIDGNAAGTAVNNNVVAGRALRLWFALPLLIWLMTLLLAPWSVVATSVNAVSDLPLITIREFLDGAPAWGEEKRVRMRGTVTHSISDRTFFIQDGDAGTYVFHKPKPALRVGEMVEVTGYASLGSVAPTLQRCDVCLLGMGKLPEPRAVTAAEARSGAYNMRVIRVQGTLAPERLRGGRILVINPGKGDQAFTADLEAFNDLTIFDSLEPGSILELTGVCTIRRDTDGMPAAFNVFIRSPGDISVFKAPPWWTPTRVRRVLGFSMLGCAVALAWVLTLRRQIRRQTAHIRQMNEQLERRVEARTEELTRANEELEAFSYSVSHDLRAPLRHISGFAAILARHPSVTQGQDLQKPVEHIHNASAKLSRMVDDMLGFSRVSRQPLSQRTVDLSGVVKNALQDLDPDTAGRQIEWKIPELPAVHGDQAALRLVWLNLLSNAVKYTRQRTPAVIEIGCQSAEGEWIFSVRDNGAGFDMRHAKNLFGVFQRLHRDDEFEGTGVGLANVRRIVHRHEGRVWAEGKPGEGATFYFALPR